MDTIKPIAAIKTDFPEKFGIPRQSGRIDALEGEIRFYPEYASFDAVRGLEEFNYLWILWRFDLPKDSVFHATVRPPRLGGNTRIGVFATRSPFRPNHIGLSCVRLKRIAIEDARPVLYVAGVDMADGTQIYDIKPYIPYTDMREDALGGFADLHKDHALNVIFPKELLDRFPEDKKEGILAILAEDPRPSYQEDPERIYGISFAGFNVQFKIAAATLTVTAVTPILS